MIEYTVHCILCVKGWDRIEVIDSRRWFYLVARGGVEVEVIYIELHISRFEGRKRNTTLLCHSILVD